MIRKCEACGASEHRVLLANQVHTYHDESGSHEWIYTLAECRHCGLVFIDPKPSWHLLQTFYDAEEYGCYSPDYALPQTEARSIKYRLAAWRYPDLLHASPLDRLKQFIAICSEWISGKTISYTLAVPLTLPKTARIFEIGYGSGNWLLAMSQLGYENLYGYDIDANSRNVNRLEAAHIIVTGGDFLQNEYPEDFFDCIRLEHVFEHLVEPDQVLEKCWRMLRSDGILVMNFPSGASTSLQVSVTHSALRASPGHLFLHTKTSAQIFLERAGFNHIKLRFYPVPLIILSTVRNYLHERNMPFPLSWLQVLSPLYSFLALVVGAGDQITLIARKLCTR